jgi:hypothetical protein
MWFEQLTGFRETSRDQVLAQLCEDGPFLESTANGRRMRRGDFAVVGLDALRQARDQAGPISGAPQGTSVREVVGNVRDLHADPASAGALFQVASQFNMLEMTGPGITPDDGIDRYELDHTQGPACAIACGAATIHRNYLVPFGSGPDVQRGQTAGRQLDGFADLAAALNLAVDMRNGYAFVPPDELDRVAAHLDGLAGPQRDNLTGLLKVGIQSQAEVTWKDAGHTVTQVFCSALPLAYAGGHRRQWEPLARLVLDAAYEGTLAAAVPAAARSGNRTVYLTLLGAGVFGNPVEWAVDALRRAVRLHQHCGLDVRVVSHGRPQQEVRTLTEPVPSWADTLFHAPPAQWGLRGDPHLWAELHEALRTVPAAPDSHAAMAELLDDRLRRLGGLDVRAPADDPVRVPRFPATGMSGGFVAPAFWRDVAVPLLLDRWSTLNGAGEPSPTG